MTWPEQGAACDLSMGMRRGMRMKYAQGSCACGMRRGHAQGSCAWGMRMGYAHGSCAWVMRMSLPARGAIARGGRKIAPGLAEERDLDIITVTVYINRQVKMSDLTPRQTQILRLVQR